MLDLETMGTSNNAAIIAIGAVEFDHTDILREYYEVIDLQSSVEAGLTIDAATVLWWMKQSDAARGQFDGSGRPLISALFDFSYWVGQCTKNPRMWGNGADFDNVILASAYRAIKEPLPWNFWANRCFRTIRQAYPNIDYEKPVVAHHALHDARAQAMHLIRLGVLENMK
jgi:exodeoxyribonuclease VIII